MSKINENGNLVKESPKRSLAKAISWRVIATSTTLLISVVIFHNMTGKTVREALEIGSVVASVELIAKLVLYYLHERIWINIKWGKYWKSRAWRRLYRRKHKGLMKR